MPIKVTSTPKATFGVAALTLDGTSVRAVHAAANALKKEILAGSPARLRGVGTRGAKLDVRYDVKGTENPTALIRAVGPWQLIESGTKPHAIAAKRNRRRSNIQASILTPQGPRRLAHHPGTRGKHTWGKGIERGTPAAVLAYTKVIRADLKKQFG